jgi:tagaturonate epimerase
MKLQKYSFGIGDRFGSQGKAQLAAMIKAKEIGIDITPVWNKSHREHSIIGTSPADVRKEADTTVKELSWAGQYCIDADHINMNNVDEFIEHSDFFTLDVADYIAKKISEEHLKAFLSAAAKYIGTLKIPDIDEKFEITENDIIAVGQKFLFAVKKAGRIYRHILLKKGKDDFVTEVSMDESDVPQSPVEMFFILLMISQEGIPAQTIAPKFTGRFNKGVDYVGDIEQFEKEFNQDIAIINFAVKEFGLPENLKLSVHSGSDKFSIYKPIKKALKTFNAGLHLKTAGTTWLEELIGLAEAGGDGLEIAKEIYARSLDQFDELCKPYATVIDIDKDALPSANEVDKWDGQKYVNTLRHNQSCEGYNLNFRQLLHVGYKIAAGMGQHYTGALEKHQQTIAHNVTKNIFDRHIKRIFLG